MPNTIPAYVEAVRILLDRGDVRRAKPLVVQAIRLEPRDDVLWGRPRLPEPPDAHPPTLAALGTTVPARLLPRRLPLSAL